MSSNSSNTSSTTSTPSTPSSSFISTPNQPASFITHSLTGDVKGDARSDRLKLRKTNEEVLKRKLQAYARKQCDEKVRDFVECTNNHGLSVIFKCREKSRISKFIIINIII